MNEARRLFANLPRHLCPTTRGREAAKALCRAQTETEKEGDNRARCRIRLGGDELATV